jgi:hypothetical protein
VSTVGLPLTATPHLTHGSELNNKPCQGEPIVCVVARRTATGAVAGLGAALASAGLAVDAEAVWWVTQAAFGGGSKGISGDGDHWLDLHKKRILNGPLVLGRIGFFRR